MKQFTYTFNILIIILFLFSSSAAASDGAEIHLMPDKAVYGTPFSLNITGLEPGEIVTLSVSAVDKRDIKWQSSATFKVNDSGIVDPAEQTPLSGDYKKADVYGLLWTMKPVNSKREKSSFTYDTDNGLIITFQVKDSEGKSTTSRLFRYYEDPETPLRRIDLNEDGLKGTLYSPDDGKKYPGVILLSGSNGGSVYWLAKAIAVQGFAVLDIPYFKYPGLPKELVNIPVEYFYRAVKWIQKQRTVKSGKIGMIGGSRGGELALQLASMFDEFKSVVAWVPAAHLWQGEDYEKVIPAWTWKGKPLPYIGEVYSKEELQKVYTGQITSYKEYFLNTLKNIDTGLIKKSVIKVENIKAPVLMISGKDDLTWPSAMFCEMIIKRLKKYGFKHEYRHLSIGNGGHLVFLPDFITATYRHFNGGTREAELHGSIRAWNESINFLRKYLED